jgi:hypothetical protein
MRPSFRQFSAAADAQTKTPLNPAPEKPGANSGEMPTIKVSMSRPWQIHCVPKPSHFDACFVNRPPHENRRQAHLHGDTEAHGFAREHVRETMNRNAGTCSSDSLPRTQHDMVHFKTSTNPHPLNIAKVSNESQFMDRHVPHPIWTDSELQNLKIVSVATPRPCKILPRLSLYSTFGFPRCLSPPLWGFAVDRTSSSGPSAMQGRMHALPHPPGVIFWITRLLALVPVHVIQSSQSFIYKPDTTDAP